MGFCAQIASMVVLKPGSPGLVLSIEGPWGYGKTSALNMIARQLETRVDPKPIIAHFNPWVIGSSSALVEEFLLQIASAVGLSLPAERAVQLSQALVSYSRLFSFLKLVPGAGPYAEMIESVLKGGSEAAAAASDLARVNIADQKKQVSEAILKLGTPIVVFVDDLDRLPPEEVFAMIRLVKAISDFPQVSYVLAFDPAYVAAALKSAMIAEGSSYLDKIIQIRLSLPRISSRQIRRLVDQEIETLLSQEILQRFEGEKDRIADLYHYAIKFLLQTPRDVYRTFNRLKLIYQTTKEELGFSDLFGLEAIAIAAPPLHQHILSRPQAYVGALDDEVTQFKSATEIVKSFKQERDEALNACRRELLAPLGDLLSRIFPLTAEGPIFDSTRPSRVTGRIANPENLLIALTSGIPTSEVSLVKVRSFIDKAGERLQVAQDVATPDKLENFLDLVSASLRRQNHVSNPDELMEALSKIAESDAVKKINQEAVRSFLKTPVGTYFFWVLREILTKLDSEEREQMIASLCQDSSKLSLSTEIIEFICLQQGLLDGKARESESFWLVSGEAMNRLIPEWLQATRGAFIDGGAFSSNWSGPALFLMRRLDRETFREVVAASLEPIDKADSLIRTLGSGSWDSSKGSYAKFSDEFLEEIGETEQLRDLAKGRLADPELTSADLRAIYTSILTGKKEYFVDFEASAK